MGRLLEQATYVHGPTAREPEFRLERLVDDTVLWASDEVAELYWLRALVDELWHQSDLTHTAGRPLPTPPPPPQRAPRCMTYESTHDSRLSRRSIVSLPSDQLVSFIHLYPQHTIARHTYTI
jgi:hypothetical protein